MRTSATTTLVLAGLTAATAHFAVEDANTAAAAAAAAAAAPKVTVQWWAAAW